MLASSREPCYTGRSPGGINPSPTNLPKCPAKPDGRKTTRAFVGRDALIPPHSAAAQTPAGGYGIRPYGRRRIPRPTGKPRPCVTTNPCRGRCLHRPGDVRGGANAPGGINPAPTNKFCVWGQTGTAAAFRAAVGRDALIPPDPAAVHPANSRDAAKRAANRFMQSPSVLIFPGAPPGPTVYGFIIWPGASNVRPAGAPSRLKYG